MKKAFMTRLESAATIAKTGVAKLVRKSLFTLWEQDCGVSANLMFYYLLVSTTCLETPAVHIEGDIDVATR